MTFTADSAHLHLFALAQKRSTIEGDVIFQSVISPETAFARSSEKPRMVFFQQTIPVSVNTGTLVRTCKIRTFDQDSNLQALRELFRATLSQDTPLTKRTEREERERAEIINFLLLADKALTKEASYSILHDHVLEQISKITSLNELENLCIGTPLVLALSLEMARVVPTANPQPDILMALSDCIKRLCTATAEPAPELVASVVRKLFDIALIAVVQHMRPSLQKLSDDERLDKLCILWTRICSLVTKQLDPQAPWASRIIDLQEQASLTKAGIALGLSKTPESVHNLTSKTKEVSNEGERNAAIAILDDITLFLQNTVERTAVLDEQVKLSLLIDKTRSQAKILMGQIPSTTAKTDNPWRIAKKLIFDLKAPLHSVLLQAFGGAVVGAAFGFISGGAQGAIVGAVAGGVSDAATVVAEKAVDPVVDHVPCTPARRRSIRQAVRTTGLPILRFILSILTARFATTWFAARQQNIAAQQRVQRLENEPVGQTGEEIHRHFSQLSEARSAVPEGQDQTQITLQSKGLGGLPSLVLDKIPGAKIITERPTWDGTLMTVEVPRAEAPKLSELSHQFREISILREQTLASPRPVSVWESVFGKASLPILDQSIRGINVSPTFTGTPAASTL